MSNRSNAEEVVRRLKQQGLLWEHAPGLYALRGAPLRLYRRLEHAIARLSFRFARGQEWLTPPALTLETLARADYFASFPQWLTTAAHLSDDPTELAAVASAEDPAAAAARFAQPPKAALQPALCYHTYAALQGRALKAPRRMTVQGTCWRHETDRFAPLERGWAFTMREVVELGGQLQIELFRQQGIALAQQLAESLGLESQLVTASDPFFAPTSRGKALLQRVKMLKHELLLPIGERAIAAASFNHHETFLGAAFGITLPDGRPAHTGCVAFGIERWLLAFLVRHGVDASNWPALPRPRALRLMVLP